MDGKPDPRRVPDGGYGWVIVVCSFMCAFVIDGLVGSFGLVYPDLVDSLHSTPSMTSMVGSALIGCFLLMGIASSRLILRFGCRPVALSGAILSSLGFVLSFFATNVWILLVTYGIIAGIGVGLLYLPAAVIVCSYFKRKLSIAQGIICSGSGVGIMSIALLIEYSLDEYGWRGTMLISAAVVFQLCVAAALMKPVSTANSETPDVVADADSNDAYPSLQQKNTDFVSHSSHYSSHVSLPISIGRSALPLEAASSFQSLHCIVTEQREEELYDKSLRRRHHEELNDHHSVSRPSLRSLKEVLKQSGYDVLPEKVKTVESDIESQSGSTSSDSSSSENDSPLWRSRAFILLGVGAVMTQMAQNIPMVFLAEYGNSVGVDRHQISFILAVFGIVNTLGRLLAGLLAYTKFVSPLCICNLGLGLCGLACLVLPLCTEFWSIMLFAVTLGFFIGFFPPMQPLMVINYVGVEKITSAFGALTMMKGPAAIAGPPLAGGLLELTNQYSTPTVCAGVLFILTVLVQGSIPFCISKSCSQSSELQHNENS